MFKRVQKKLEADVSFTVCSDLHLEANSLDECKSLFNSIRLDDTDVTICCGDYLESWDNDKVLYPFLLESRVKNFVACKGNHDNFNLWRQCFGNKVWYNFTLNDYQFYILFNDGTNCISRDKQQWEWLNSEMKANTKMKFAFIHQPPHFVPRWAHHSYQADKTHALFRESNVHSVFCGHIHTFDFERVDNINYLVTGGLNDIRRNTNTLKIFSKHYLSVSVKNNKVTIFRVDLDGTETLICQ